MVKGEQGARAPPLPLPPTYSPWATQPRGGAWDHGINRARDPTTPRLLCEYCMQ